MHHSYCLLQFWQPDFVTSAVYCSAVIFCSAVILQCSDFVTSGFPTAPPHRATVAEMRFYDSSIYLAKSFLG